MDLPAGKEMSLDKKDAIARDGYVFFYQRGCGYCKTMHPLVMQAAEKAGVRVFFVDIDNNEEMRKFFNVRGWPALYHIVNKKIAAEFDGPRNVAEIVKFLS